MPQPFLEIEHMSKTFPGVKALDDVHFDIYPGEVHSLVGENGAGKSTLIKILSGMYQPDEGGVIKINGQVTKIHSIMDAISKGISVVYQDFSLFRNLTVAENVVINQMIEGKKRVLNWKEIKNKAAEALAVIGADIDPSEVLGNLSVAKQQMVAISGAIAQKAQMIIMDEPTSSLSQTEVETLYKIIESLKARDIAVMFVSHKMEELFRISNRFTVLRDGRFVHCCNAGEIDRERLIAMMVGRQVDLKQHVKRKRSDEVVLEVDHLTKRGNFKDISFKLHKGEILGVTGLVGAGRSEMVQAIFGLYKPDKGTIKIRGQVVHCDNPWEALRLGVGYVPESRQTQGLVLSKSVSENITLPMLKNFTSRFGLVNRKKQMASVHDWIDRLDVRPKDPELLAVQLSGGNQQKVVLAKWIATNPSILLVDEPTNGVDIGAKAEIHRILREIAENGTSIIVISSELPEILAISDRIVIMRHGRISGEFENQSVTQEMIMDCAVAN